MIKRSVAVVVRGPEAGTFLVVKRPDDPGDPLAGVWGLPAVTLADGEDERAAAVRVGRDKLGVELAPGQRLGEASADRGDYLLVLADYEATIVDGIPAVPQPDTSVTQYVEWRYAADPAVLAQAADRGSLCARIFLEDNSKKRSRGTPEAERVAEFRARVGLDSIIDVHTHFMPERLLAAVWAYFDAAGPLIGRPWPITYREDEQTRVSTLRAFGVAAFTALLYPHKPGMARSLNEWGADFAARTPGLPAQRHILRRTVGRRRRPPGDRAGRAGVQMPPAGRRLRPERPAARRGLGAAGGGGRPGRDALRLRSGGRPLHRAWADRADAGQAPGAAAGGRPSGHARVRRVPDPGRALPGRSARHDDGVHAVHRGRRRRVPARRTAAVA